MFIYKIRIGNHEYIGKTNNIKRREDYHRYLLKKNKHYNKGLQSAYNKHKEIKSSILWRGTDPKTAKKEEEAQILKSKNNPKVVNVNVSNGEGLKGLKRNISFKKNLSKRMSGEGNPSNKITFEDFLKMIRMFEDLQSNEDIAKEFNLHPRYVSLIRHKRRLKSFWDRVNSAIVKSPGNKKLSFNDFRRMVKSYQEGVSIKQLSSDFSLERSAVSRIVRRKSYKDYWDLLDGSTTTERAESTE